MLEVRMGGIEEVVVLIGNDDAGHPEDGGCPLISPSITDALGGRGRRTPAPIRRKLVQGDRENECVVEGCRDQDVTREWPQGAQARQDLKEAKCSGSGCVGQRDSGAVPAATELPCFLAVEGRTGVAILNDPPYCGHVTEECRVPAVRPDSLLREHRSL